MSGDTAEAVRHLESTISHQMFQVLVLLIVVACLQIVLILAIFLAGRRAPRLLNVQAEIWGRDGRHEEYRDGPIER